MKAPNFDERLDLKPQNLAGQVMLQAMRGLLVLMVAKGMLSVDVGAQHHTEEERKELSISVASYIASEW